MQVNGILTSRLHCRLIGPFHVIAICLDRHFTVSRPESGFCQFSIADQFISFCIGARCKLKQDRLLSTEYMHQHFAVAQLRCFVATTHQEASVDNVAIILVYAIYIQYSAY